MSFIINQNFDLKSPQFNFARDYFADVASLKAASENDFPDHFITNVAGTLYQLTKGSNADTITGKWRKIKLGSDVDLSGYATTAALNNKVDKVSGKGLSTNDFTAAYKTKLDGIASGANNYSLPVAGTNLGGIKLGYSPSGKNYPVQLDSTNKAYVYVPWTDTDTKYSLPTATDNVLGGIKIGFKQDDVNHNYPIALNTNNQAYVNVPLATYNIFDDTDQKDGLITGAEKRAIHLLSLDAVYLANDGGLRLILNGVMEDNSGIVDIPFATSGMGDLEYGLMKGSDKRKLDNITISTKVSSDSTSLVTGGGIYTALSGKVDKAAGKDLSTNDFTTAYKTKLDGIAAGANKTIVDTDFNQNSNNAIANSTVAEFNYKIRETIDTININLRSLQTSVNNITAIPDTEITKLFN